MKILIFCISALFCITGCVNKKSSLKKEEFSHSLAKYNAIKIIDSLALRSQVDSIKWMIYQKQSTTPFVWSINIKDSQKITLGELNIELSNVEIKNDTLVVFVCYSKLPYYSCGDSFIGNECIISGAGFDLKSKSYYTLKRNVILT